MISMEIIEQSIFDYTNIMHLYTMYIIHSELLIQNK